MSIVDFESIDPRGIHRQQSYGDRDPESCFEMLSLLVRNGWQLIRVDYFASGTGIGMKLPIEAFTGEPMRAPIRLLEEEWKELIVNS
ncbi:MULTISPECIES: hypothetical protein [Spirosoma]|uniref:DUF4177 domain-containing protein n=1 Tax=Spirosoma liriopis TaxID=2937440 RepID=A0ABT0HMX4_9BACT|nr:MULTISPECIES: hypothetical protein [Spirosoma]MCK8493526.1 hypothetical protein [Spirosoma liriopis]UHG92964.1 hypothetical protein LQ777_08690 [Spirosoma oryzicola]